MTIWQLSCVLCVWVWENEADCWCLLSVFWCCASVPRARLPRAHFLWSPSEQMESTWRLRHQQWQTKLHFLPQSARRGFNTGNMSGCSWEMACYRCNRDSINNPLPDTDINMCDTFGHSMIQLARVCASPFYTQLCKFQQIRNLEKWGTSGETFPSAAPDAVYTLLHHDVSQQVGTDLCSFIMPCQSLRRQLNVLLHLVWENMLRCIPVWQTGDISSSVRWRGVFFDSCEDVLLKKKCF